MKINGKVHCFFEQSGTFKNEFRKLGYEAYDYDIQDNFGETDHVIDLFAEIELLQQINSAISREKDAKADRKKAEDALKQLRAERLNPQPTLF